jgi:hypothetical protein
VVAKWFIFFLQIFQNGHFHQMFDNIGVIAGMITMAITQHGLKSKLGEWAQAYCGFSQTQVQSSPTPIFRLN